MMPLTGQGTRCYIEHNKNVEAAMMKPAAPQQVLAERHFPVRVRMAVPARGIGSQFSIMCAWLDRHAGKSGYFTGAEAGAGLRDGALFYVVDQKIAAAFVDRVCIHH
jgi:hypothetical protein